MIEKQINLDNVTSVEIHDKKKNQFYDYYPYRKKTFWQSERKEGFYGSYMDPMTVDEMKKECIVIDNIPYFKPYIVINSGKDSSYKTFNSIEECRIYVDEVFGNIKKIIIK